MHERRRPHIQAGRLSVVTRGALGGCALIAALLAVASAGAPAPLSVAQTRDIGALANRMRASEDVPGLSVAVVRNGRIAFAAGFGLRDRGRRLAADAATRYGIGSVTKTIVAALIMQLVEAHRLSLDDSLVKWLPYFTHAEGVRVGDLLAQRSGIPDYNGAAFLVTVLPDVLPGRVDRDAILRALAREPLAFPPGSSFAYSNANYLLLGTIAERAGGAPLPTLLTRRIFAPAGMRDTELGDTIGADDAIGYTRGPFGPIALGAWDPQLTFAAGGIRSTVIDLARFDVALLAGRVVSPRSLASMARAQGPARGATGYGFGLFASEDGARRVLWHDGTVLGFKAMNLLAPATNDAVVVLANSDYAHAPTLARDIDRVARGASAARAEPLDADLVRWPKAIRAALVLGIIALVASGALIAWRRRRIWRRRI